MANQTSPYLSERAILASQWDLASGVLREDNISIKTYEKMLYSDAQVSAAGLLFKIALLSKGWDIQYPQYSSGKKDMDKLKLMQQMFMNVNRSSGYRGGLREAIEEMLNTPLFGFSVTEIVYAYDKDNKIYKLSKLKVIPQSQITFKVDTKGNLAGIVQTTDSGEIDLKPLEKFIVWTFRRNGKNVYGNGLLKAAYKHWYIKNFLLKQWGIYLEKKANPVPIAKTKKSRFKRMTNMLKNLNVRSYAVIDSDDAIDIINPRDVGGQYRDAIRYQDTMIFRALWTPTLLMGQEDVGARALGDTHFQVFMWIVNTMKENLINIMNELIMNIWKVNWGENDIYPVFVIPELSEEDKYKFAQMVNLMVNAGVFAPDEEWIRMKLGAPVKMTEPLSPNAATPPGGGAPPSPPPSSNGGDNSGR